MRTTLHTLRPLITVSFLSILLTACGGGGSSAPPPTGFELDPGDGQITVKWVADPNVQYWLAWWPGTTVSTESNSTHYWAGLGAYSGLTSPYVQAGLLNGTTYAFSVNGRINGGPGGPGTASLTAVPRPGGATWQPGTGSTAGAPAMGTSVMHAAAFGTASDSTLNYVAVGDSGALYKSTDGRAWTAITSGPAATTVDFKAASYALGKYFAAGSSGQIYYSADMVTWTGPATSAASGTISNTTAQINALATNGSTLVAVGDNGTIRYSTDGITWSIPTTVPTTANLRGVIYSGSGLWIAVGANGTILSSPDALTWTAQTGVTPSTTASLNAIAAQYSSAIAKYTYVAVGDGGVVVKSNDGVTWTTANVGTATDVFTAVVVPSTNSQFLTISSTGKVFTGVTSLTSPYDVTWADPRTASNPACDTANWLGMISAQVQYVAFGSGGATCNSH